MSCKGDSEAEGSTDAKGAQAIPDGAEQGGRLHLAQERSDSDKSIDRQREWRRRWGVQGDCTWAYDQLGTLRDTPLVYVRIAYAAALQSAVDAGMDAYSNEPEVERNVVSIKRAYMCIVAQKVREAQAAHLVVEVPVVPVPSPGTRVEQDVIVGQIADGNARIAGSVEAEPTTVSMVEKVMRTVMTVVRGEASLREPLVRIALGGVRRRGNRRVEQ